jgi:hypothetical protein
MKETGESKYKKKEDTPEKKRQKQTERKKEMQTKRGKTASIKSFENTLRIVENKPYNSDLSLFVLLPIANKCQL